MPNASPMFHPCFTKPASCYLQAILSQISSLTSSTYQWTVDFRSRSVEDAGPWQRLKPQNAKTCPWGNKKTCWNPWIIHCFFWIIQLWSCLSQPLQTESATSQSWKKKHLLTEARTVRMPTSCPAPTVRSYQEPRKKQVSLAPQNQRGIIFGGFLTWVEPL